MTILTYIFTAEALLYYTSIYTVVRELVQRIFLYRDGEQDSLTASEYRMKLSYPYSSILNPLFTRYFIFTVSV